MKLNNSKIRYTQCRGCGIRIPVSLFRYCPDCSKVAFRLEYERISVKSKKSFWAYVHRNGRKCFLSGMSLEVVDYTCPWFLVFGRLKPGDKTKIFPASALFNAMKGRLSKNEFRYFVLALDDHRKKHLKVKKIPLVHWKGIEGEKVCVGCAQAAALKGRVYCAKCARIAYRMKRARFPRKAMNGVWKYIRKYGYICYYTGIKLNLDDPQNPWYLVFDHWKPRDPRKIVITSSLINRMKTDLTEEEFWYFIRQLANYYRKGTVVKKRKLSYWYRSYRLY